MFKLKWEAQEILDSGIPPHKQEDRLGAYVASISCNEGFWYAFTFGGYVEVEDILADSKEIEKVKEAFELLGELKDLWESVSVGL